MSETAAARPILAQYCTGFGLDMGFGGSAIVPDAITFDMPKGYCPSLEGHKQILQGDCRNLSFLCDEVFDYIYSSHLLEDFSYSELVPILKEWRRVLKKDGLLVTNCPDQQKFLRHCEATGQPLNLAHKEQDFSLANFRNVANQTGLWEEVFVEPNAGPYSFYIVLRKK
jgi:predicted SAM-dependent methyltransferase